VCVQALPLRFTFSYVPVNITSTAASRYVQATPSLSNTSQPFILPSAGMFDDGEYRVFAHAVDVNGAENATASPALVISRAPAQPHGCVEDCVTAAADAILDQLSASSTSLVAYFNESGSPSAFIAGVSAHADMLQAVSTADLCDGVDCNGSPCVAGVCVCTNGYSGARCTVGPKPVDGYFSEWSSFSACFGSCSNSTKARTRVCVPPRFGGVDCAGETTEFTPCDSAPIDCSSNRFVWAEWSAWSQCSSQCPGNVVDHFPGTQTRNRTLLYPAWSALSVDGVASAMASASDSRLCNTQLVRVRLCLDGVAPGRYAC
jgi:hypothetical protein